MNTKSQLLELNGFKLNPDLLIYYVMDKFDVESLEDIERPIDERLAGWKNLLDYFDKLPDKYIKYRSLMLLKILDLSFKIDCIDEELLIRYLNQPLNIDSGLFKKEFKNKQKSDKNDKWANIIGFNQNIDEDKLVNKYLKRVFAHSSKTNVYLEFFNEKTLAQLVATAKLSSGQQVDDVNSIFTERELQEIHSSKLLDLVNNAHKFSFDQKVIIKLQLKNISNLKVRVFEVNTLNYLLEKNSDSYDSIDVTGLIPFEEYVYNYNQSSMIIHNEEFEFKSIGEKDNGVFIVDFIGEELNSRAIIFKGSLTVINDGQTGRNCFILDKSGKVCHGKGTGFYIGSTFLASDPVTGIISVPLNIASLSQMVIVVHEGFAALSFLSISDPQPKLIMNALYNAESFITGNQVEFLIQSKLMMNEQLISISKLSNACIIVTASNGEGLKSQNIFKDLKFKDTEDVKISFIFPPKVQTLKIEMSGEIKIGTQNQTLSATQTLLIEDLRDSIIERFYFTKNDKNELLLDVLGRNGEPIPNIPVSINLELEFQRLGSNIQFISDSKGQVHIGHIQHLKRITASGSFGSIVYSEYKKKCSIYPPSITLVEDEAIELPLYKNEEKVSLIQLSSSGTVKYSLAASNTKIIDNMLTIFGLKASNYCLMIGNQCIDVSVLKGEYFDLNGENIKTSNQIVPLPKTSQHLLSNPNKNENGQLYVEVEGDSENLRAHLFTYNYVPQERMLIANPLQQFSISGAFNSRPPFTIETKSNVYKSGKRLNDEVIYVYDRQTKPGFMGNTLEKPGMLIKREKIGQTSEAHPEINKGHDFENEQANNKHLDKLRKRGGDANKKVKEGNIESIRCVPQIRTLPFLAHPGKIYSNLKIRNNIVELPKEAIGEYAYSMLVLTDGCLTSHLELTGTEIEVARADCRLPESKKPGYVIQYERRLSGVQQGQSVSVKNIKNTEMCVIDDMKSLFETLQLLNEGDNQQLKEWEFLKSWANLAPMEKLQKYDKYASHELNLFLFNKDREFFDGVVSGFIQSKKEKQFIDWYLLQDDKMLATFCDFSSFKILNILELVLLAQVSVKLNEPFSTAILKYLKSTSSLRNVDEKRKSMIFDTLLSSKGEKVNIDDIEEKSKIHPRFGGMFGSSLRSATPTVQDKIPGSINLLQRTMRGKQECLRSARMPSKEKMALNMELEDNDFVQTIDIYTPSQGTIEYKETQFWKMGFNNDIQIFWSDLADHLVSNNSSKNFLPESFIYSVRNFSYAVVMLTFIDMSFDKIKLESKIEASDLVIMAPNNLLLLTKEIIEKKGDFLDVNVLCAQRFFDPTDQFVYDDQDPTLKVDKQVDEFIINKIYGSRIVVTNCTNSDLALNVTHEVPQGAIPLGSQDFVKVNSQVFGSLQSQVFEFSFYFPAAGNFFIYPATVSKESRIIASAKIDSPLQVKPKKILKNLETIGDILSMGNESDIIDFIKTKNILNDKIFQFSDIYWLLNNKEFYRKCVDVLRSKGLYEDTVWSFSLYHGDLETWREFMKPKINSGEFNFAKYINNGIIKMDRFEIREYYPLINKRAHSLGSERVNIFNNAFKATYLKFLYYLLEKGNPSFEDWLLLADYLMAQDRFDEAIAVYGRVSNDAQESVQTKIQRDYLLAYIDFVNGYPEFKTAKRICGEYLTYPVLSWRNLFIEMANQIAEFEESDLIETSLESKQGKTTNTDRALKAPNFTAELEIDRLKIVSQNVGTLQIDYYKIDIEVLFSLNPFNLEQGKSYSHVKPFAQECLTLQSSQDHVVYHHNLPINLNKENLFIQVSLNEKGISNSQFFSYLPFNFYHNLNQEFGIIKLMDPITKKPVPKVYVKCFVKYKNGTIAFYKDGYTDLRGSFDYVSLNKDEVNDVDRFSLIVCGGPNGYRTFEVQPPKKIGRVEGEAKQLVSKIWADLQKQNLDRPELSKYARLII